jgi:hypothetical protein
MTLYKAPTVLSKCFRRELSAGGYWLAMVDVTSVRSSINSLPKRASGRIILARSVRFRRSAAHPCRQVRGIPTPLHRDLGKRAVDVAEIIRRQFDASRSEVLVQAM